jgi:excisionase family DNA binding protein
MTSDHHVDQGRVGSAQADARGRTLSRQFFSIADVAEITGVSTRTVRRWIKRKEMIAHRFGVAVRVAESDLKAFLAQHRNY